MGWILRKYRPKPSHMDPVRRYEEHMRFWLPRGAQIQQNTQKHEVLAPPGRWQKRISLLGDDRVVCQHSLSLLGAARDVCQLLSSALLGMYASFSHLAAQWYRRSLYHVTCAAKSSPCAARNSPCAAKIQPCAAKYEKIRGKIRESTTKIREHIRKYESNPIF